MKKLLLIPAFCLALPAFGAGHFTLPGIANPGGWLVGAVVAGMRKKEEQRIKEYREDRIRDMKERRRRDQRDAGGGRTVRDGGNRGTLGGNTEY
jgi:hypothetical protein